MNHLRKVTFCSGEFYSACIVWNPATKDTEVLRFTERFTHPKTGDLFQWDGYALVQTYLALPSR